MNRLFVVLLLAIGMAGCKPDGKVSAPTKKLEAAASAQKAAAAVPLTAEKAKALAERALRVMNEAETYAVIAGPDRISSETYAAKFDAPLGKLVAEWPAPYYAPENKALEPYQICIDAALSLKQLKFSRVNKMPDDEVAKHRKAYFSDQKPRCEQSIKTGKYTPKQ
jgi:hypothetical protein